MSHQFSKLRQESQTGQSHQEATGQSSQVAGVEFSSVDELLRFDSGQNPVPAEVEDRLKRSIAAEPLKPQPWYKKLFRGGSE